MRSNSGFGATTRMHLSCSLVAASASPVQRVLDNLFCISGICMGRGVVRAWPGNGNRICLHFEQWCGPVLPMPSEMLPLQPVLVKPVLHFLTSSHNLPWRRLFTNSTQSIPDPGSGCPGPCISKYSLLIKLLSGFLVQVL